MEDKGRRGTLRLTRNSSNSSNDDEEVHSRTLLSSSHKAAELTIEALDALRAASPFCCEVTSCDVPPDECERARLIGEITRLLREPCMPETTRTAGLTLIGYLARRMPGELPHALGVMEARQYERRVRTVRKVR